MKEQEPQQEKLTIGAVYETHWNLKIRCYPNIVGQSEPPLRDIEVITYGRLEKEDKKGLTFVQDELPNGEEHLLKRVMTGQYVLKESLKSIKKL